MNNRYLIKASMLIQKYQNEETGSTMWLREGEPALSSKWFPIKGHTKYIKKADTSVDVDTSNTYIYDNEKDADPNLGSMKQYALSDPPGISLQNQGQNKMNKYLVKIAASKKKDVAVGAVVGAGVGAGVGAAAEAAHHANKALPPGFIQGSEKPPLSDKEYHTNQAAMHESKLKDLSEIRQKLIKSKNLSGDASQKIDKQINRLKSAKAKSLFDAMKSKGEPIGKATSIVESAASKMPRIPKKGLLAGALLGSSIGLAKHYLSKDKSK